MKGTEGSRDGAAAPRETSAVRESWKSSRSDPLIDRFAIRPGIPASMLDNPILT